MISKSGTCRVTKLFLNNNQFTTVSWQIHIGKFDTAKFRQWELLDNKQKTLQPLGRVIVEYV